jgi:hypothetical protein
MNLRNIISSEIATFRTFLDSLWRIIVKIIILMSLFLIFISAETIISIKLGYDLNKNQEGLMTLALGLMSILIQSFIVSRIRFLNKYPSKNMFEKIYQKKKI